MGLEPVHVAPNRRVACQGQRLTGVLALRDSLGGESVRAAPLLRAHVLPRARRRVPGTRGDSH